MPLKAELDAVQKNYVKLMKLPMKDLLPALKMVWCRCLYMGVDTVDVTMVTVTMVLSVRTLLLYSYHP